MVTSLITKQRLSRSEAGTIVKSGYSSKHACECNYNPIGFVFNLLQLEGDSAAG